MDKNEAREQYNKLKNKWGISKIGYPIAVRGPGVIKNNLFYPCYWTGLKLNNDYKRLTFKDFIKLYNIKIKKGE